MGKFDNENREKARWRVHLEGRGIRHAHYVTTNCADTLNAVKKQYGLTLVKSSSAQPCRYSVDATLITQATEIRMRAERRAGELLIEMAERGERDSGKGNRDSVLKSQAATPKLSDLEIGKTQSSRWWELARISDHTFDARVERASAAAYDRITGRLRKEAEIERARQHHSKIVEHGCTVDDLRALAESGRRFGVIYADPPWPFATRGESGKGRSPDNHDGTSAIDEIFIFGPARWMRGLIKPRPDFALAYID